MALKDYGEYNDDDIQFHFYRDEHPDPDQFRLHTHDMCELYCFVSGQGVFRIEGSEYHLQPGDILVMRPAEAHYIEPNAALPYERIALHFRRSLLDGIDPDHMLLTPFYNRDPGRFNLFRGDDFPTQDYQHYISNLLRPAENRRVQILSALIPLLNELMRVSMRREERHCGDEDSPMAQVIRYINRNLSQNLSLDSLCERFFISKPQLCRAFKRATGASVGEYINVKRLLYAQELLHAGMPPTQVCNTCGYNDYSTFYRAYRKHFGVTPRQAETASGSGYAI